MYCTYLITYFGNKLPMFYIGSTSIKNVNSGYMGSVSSKQYKSIWENELLINPSLFKIRIISKHPTRKEAYEKEDSLQRHLKVISNRLYANKSYAFGVDNSGENNPMYGKVRNDCKQRMLTYNPMKDPKIRKKMSATKLRNKCIPWNKGATNDTQRLKMLQNNPMKDISTQQKMLKTRMVNNGGMYPCKNTIWVANIVLKIRKRVTLSEYELLDSTWIKLGNKVPIPDLHTSQTF